MAAKVKEIKQEAIAQEQEDVKIAISAKELEGYIQIVRVILVDDSRALPVEKHFVNMVNKAHEEGQKQSE